MKSTVCPWKENPVFIDLESVRDLVNGVYLGELHSHFFRIAGIFPLFG